MICKFNSSRVHPWQDPTTGIILFCAAFRFRVGKLGAFEGSHSKHNNLIMAPISGRQVAADLGAFIQFQCRDSPLGKGKERLGMIYNLVNILNILASCSSIKLLFPRQILSTICHNVEGFLDHRRHLRRPGTCSSRRQFSGST
jgi:hypothetical protein